MEKDKPLQIKAGISGGQRLHLKQLLSEAIDQLTDQLIQIEQSISQGLPELAAGLSSARNMRELESLLKELTTPQANYPQEFATEALTSAAAMSWREERSWAQAREQALEKGVANLLQAAWLGTALKRQTMLTEGLIAAKRMVDNRKDIVSEGYH
ncbi:MAG: hypothetical protein ACOYEO_06580 [bacterium]|jgi:hypothetical protein